MPRLKAKDVPHSKHFCILPWLHIQLNHGGNAYPCCRIGDVVGYSYGSVSDSGLGQILQTDEANVMRAALLQDKPVQQCSDCYQLEAAGGSSMRQEKNRAFKDYWPILDQTGLDGAVEKAEIVYLDLRFSNLCNLKCRSCGPYNSTSWHEEAKKISTIAKPNTEKLVALSTKTITEIDSILPSLREILFAGGEPLLEKHHYQLLEKLIKLGKKDISLHYNTNFSRLEYQEWSAIQLWKKFKNVRVGASLDGVGRQAELLRKGQDWDETKSNFERLKKEAPHVDFYIHCTVSVMNIFHLTEAISEWVRLKILERPEQLQINIVRDPLHIHPDLLNESERARLAEHYEQFLDEIRGTISAPLFKSINASLRLILNKFSKKVLIEERKVFRSFTFKLDKTRGERFVALFPEHFDLLYGTSLK